MHSHTNFIKGFKDCQDVSDYMKLRWDVFCHVSVGEECEAMSEAAAAVHPDHFYTP